MLRRAQTQVFDYFKSELEVVAELLYRATKAHADDKKEPTSVELADLEPAEVEAVTFELLVFHVRRNDCDVGRTCSPSWPCRPQSWTLWRYKTTFPRHEPCPRCLPSLPAAPQGSAV